MNDYLGYYAVFGAAFILLIALVRWPIRKAMNRKNQKEAEKREAEEAARPKLMTCPDCGSEVSTLAEHCPKCGRPFQRTAVSKENSKGNGTTIFIAVVLGILIAAWILTKILRIEINGTIVPIK